MSGTSGTGQTWTLDLSWACERPVWGFCGNTGNGGPFFSPCVFRLWGGPEPGAGGVPGRPRGGQASSVGTPGPAVPVSGGWSGPRCSAPGFRRLAWWESRSGLGAQFPREGVPALVGGPVPAAGPRSRRGAWSRHGRVPVPARGGGSPGVGGCPSSGGGSPPDEGGSRFRQGVSVPAGVPVPAGGGRSWFRWGSPVPAGVGPPLRMTRAALRRRSGRHLRGRHHMGSRTGV